MPIRYFKCHTLPFPSQFTPTTEWEIASLGNGRMSVDIGYRHGPPGQDPPTAMTTQIEWSLVGQPTATTIATVASGPLDYAYRFDDISAAETAFRVRRVNSVGAGEWSAYAIIEAP